LDGIPTLNYFYGTVSSRKSSSGLSNDKNNATGRTSDADMLAGDADVSKLDPLYEEVKNFDESRLTSSFQSVLEFPLTKGKYPLKPPQKLYEISKEAKEFCKIKLIDPKMKLFYFCGDSGSGELTMASPSSMNNFGDENDQNMLIENRIFANESNGSNSHNDMVGESTDHNVLAKTARESQGVNLSDGVREQLQRKQMTNDLSMGEKNSKKNFSSSFGAVGLQPRVYFGTKSLRSSQVTGRRPFVKDLAQIDYDAEDDDEEDAESIDQEDQKDCEEDKRLGELLLNPGNVDDDEEEDDDFFIVDEDLEDDLHLDMDDSYNEKDDHVSLKNTVIEESIASNANAVIVADVTNKHHRPRQKRSPHHKNIVSSSAEGGVIEIGPFYTSSSWMKSTILSHSSNHTMESHDGNPIPSDSSTAIIATGRRHPLEAYKMVIFEDILTTLSSDAATNNSNSNGNSKTNTDQGQWNMLMSYEELQEFLKIVEGADTKENVIKKMQEKFPKMSSNKIGKQLAEVAVKVKMGADNGKLLWHVKQCVLDTLTKVPLKLSTSASETGILPNTSYSMITSTTTINANNNNTANANSNSINSNAMIAEGGTAAIVDASANVVATDIVNILVPRRKNKTSEVEQKFGDQNHK